MSGLDSSSSTTDGRTDLYHGTFRWYTGPDGLPRLMRHDAGPVAVPCPTTGRPLRIATIEAGASAICPGCASQGHGGFISFDGDLRMAYACPQCRQLVWVAAI